MTAENDYRLGRRAFHRNQEESISVALAIVAVLLLAGGSYILVDRFHVRSVQLLEGCLYAFFALIAGIALAWYLLTLRLRREAPIAKGVNWTKLRYAFFTSPRTFVVDREGIKLRFRLKGLCWRLNELDLGLGGTES